MPGVPAHFWFGGESSKKFSLIKLVHKGRDITIYGIQAIVEKEWWVVEWRSDVMV